MNSAGLNEISVVTAVYNGGSNLLESLATILDQDVDLEFILVDDGSTDATPQLLRTLADEDKRIRVFSQPNRGLTASLTRGCVEARGEFIARHDCGDKSLPGRLARQLAALKAEPGASFHSCGTRFIAPEGIELYSARRTTEELNQALRSKQIKGFYGPSSHPSVLLRRSAYEKCGGYRGQFYFAQDLDLWCRMIHTGPALADPWIGYEAVIETASLSGEYRDEQQRLRTIIYQLTKNLDPDEQNNLLREAASIRPQPGKRRETTHWRGNYFLASCLAGKDNELARIYMKKALAEHPAFIKGWLKYLALLPRLRRNGGTS